MKEGTDRQCRADVSTYPAADQTVMPAKSPDATRPLLTPARMLPFQPPVCSLVRRRGHLQVRVASGEGGAWRLSFLPWEGPGLVRMQVEVQDVYNAAGSVREKRMS
ncbi:hypothetical protein PF001_g17159 [Phytophthora fragariae]|uniref:Uncharacterized protein n=1 Tax=Phytophthora fragariae TaxID=53985 RepID=A0A6A4CSK5_9STRA|nr:hypothetical protein PF001_g17159 [Phytophthora fragariae]